MDDGIDEIVLALTADAWSRTFRATALTTHPSHSRVQSRRGLLIEVDARDGSAGHTPPFADRAPGAALDGALRDIAVRYGEHTAGFVALQLEYPR